jgi:hypothetical protein
MNNEDCNLNILKIIVKIIEWMKELVNMELQFFLALSNKPNEHELTFPIVIYSTW